MRWEWRKLREGEFDAPLLYVCVASVSLLVAAFWFFFQLPTPPCHFKLLTGYPCLTCGSTRCVQGMFRGDWPGAWGYNPLVFSGFVLAGIIYIASAFNLIMTNKRLCRIRIEGRLQNVFRVLLILAVALNWVYLIRFLP